MTDEWQPIETAPRDQWLLVAGQAVDGLYVYTAKAQDWDYEGKAGTSWDGPYADGYPADLRDIGGGEPTHWMPLPAPPSEVG